MQLIIKKVSSAEKRILVSNVTEAIAKFIFSKEMNMLKKEDFAGCFILNDENKPLYKVDWDRNVYQWDGNNNKFTEDDILVVL